MNYLGRKLTPEKKPRRPIRKLGRLGKLRAKGKRDAKQHYWQNFQTYGDNGPVVDCQSCGRRFEIRDTDAHHKIKASAGGSEDFKNIVCICRSCHQFIHLPGFKERVDHVARQEANVENGKKIDWATFTHALTKWRLAWR